MTIRAWMLIAVTIAACGDVEPVPESPADWTIDHVTQDGAVLGVWGTAPNNVWAVGGQADHALVLHGDGTSWTPFAVDAPSMLFAVYGFSDSDIYAVGEAGLILHYDGATWTRIDSGTKLALFGLWGASGDDVWIVGGDVSGPAGSALVLRGTAGKFVVQELPADLGPSALFKVHGFAPDNVVMVGSGGVLRWDGAWRRDAVPTTEPLFSTWGTGPSDLYAVGGRDVGEILHSDGQHWSQLFELPTGSGLSGVFTAAGESTIAVGANSFVFEVDLSGALVHPTLPALDSDPFFHGVWGDGRGSTYVVGGDLLAYPQPMSGVILRRR